jgi:hypothetical protein
MIAKLTDNFDIILTWDNSDLEQLRSPGSGCAALWFWAVRRGPSLAAQVANLCYGRGLADEQLNPFRLRNPQMKR